jgi:proton-translocating NADH-quinone oxidoreductase chain N
MAHPSVFTLLIAIPVLASPLIYLLGRIGKISIRPQNPLAELEPLQNPRLRAFLNSTPRWTALLALLASWGPFVLAVDLFRSQGPQTFFIENIPLRLDGISLLLAAVSLGLGTLVVLFSGPYMAKEPGEEKYYAMLTAMVGVMIALGCAGDLFNLWVWFEAMAVSSYLLVVFYREQPASLEAGIKYVVQSAAGSVLVLLGIALVLAETGTMNLNEIAAAVGPSPLLVAAGGLFIAGFGVKAALVPLHTWLPDAHSQAPSGISAMLSGVVIEAGLIAMLRALSSLTGENGAGVPAATWGGLLLAFGAVNMLVGNLMALRQTQIKRMLAYSSLSHIGYMVFGLGAALTAGQLAGAQGGMFHLLNHGLMKGLAFLAAGALLYAVSGMALKAASAAADERQADDHGPLTVSDLNGAAQRYPLEALALSLAVLGLAGLPPLAGFMSKWQIFVAGMNAGVQQDSPILGLLVIFAALNSVLSLGYYAPLVNAMYRKQPSEAVVQGGAIPLQMSVPLALLALGVVALGVWPNLVGWLVAPAGSALLAAFGG